MGNKVKKCRDTDTKLQYKAKVKILSCNGEQGQKSQRY